MYVEVKQKLDNYKQKNPNWQFHAIECVYNELNKRVIRLKNLPQNTKLSTEDKQKLTKILTSITALSIKAHTDIVIK